MKLVDKFRELSQSNNKKEKRIFQYLYDNYSLIPNIKQQKIARHANCSMPYISYVLKKHKLGEYRQLKMRIEYNLLNNDLDSVNDGFVKHINQSLLKTKEWLEYSQSITKLADALTYKKNVRCAMIATVFTLQLMRILAVRLRRSGIIVDVFSGEPIDTSFANYDVFIFASITGSNNNLQRVIKTLDAYEKKDKKIFLITLEKDYALEMGKIKPEVILGISTGASSLSRKEFPEVSSHIILYINQLINREVKKKITERKNNEIKQKT